MSSRIMESIKLTLKYEGPDVNDGSMSVEDIVAALQGFASAYQKVADHQNSPLQHKIRIVGLEKSSANIIIEVWQWLGQSADQLTSLQVLGGGAVVVSSAILSVIKLKKHTRGESHTTQLVANGIAVNNSQNVQIIVSPEHYNIFKERLIDEDLAKIAKPLKEDKVDSAQLKISDAEQETIAAADKALFTTRQKSTTVSEMVVDGRLVSLNKTTNAGTFELSSGQTVRYRFAPTNLDQLYSDFSYRGPVRVHASARLDEELRPVALEISRVERLQHEIFPETIVEESSESSS